MLRNQLHQYKELIKQRVSDTTPVITFQDNMQLMQTSLHHLRPSKLQKVKTKQGKVWHFTVQGWKVADVGCIEEFSSCHDNVPEAQKDVRAVKYEDLLIGW